MGTKIITRAAEENPLTWEEFEEQVQADIESTKEKQEEKGSSHSNWIYRGQANANWSLLTTLERYYKDELGREGTDHSIQEYYESLGGIIPILNSLKKTNFESINSEDEIFKTSELHSRVASPELLCYVRHLGFPSPLLDWSMSYYIAAFFAFQNIKKEQNVAIFSYKQWNGEPRNFSFDEPLVSELGNLIKTHQRHFNQQSIYTTCRTCLRKETVFSNHDLAISISPSNQRIKKFILKGEEREKVLKKLFMMNINHYTLFGDEESLMKMLAFKAFRKL